MPGVCGLETILTAESEDGSEVTLKAESACGAVRKLIEALEQPLDAYEICFKIRIDLRNCSDKAQFQIES